MVTKYDSTAIRLRYDHSTTYITTVSLLACGLLHCGLSKQAVREAATICCCPRKLTIDLLTLKVVSESRVTWATSLPILIFLGLSVLDLDPMYATDRQTDVRQTSDAQHRLNASALWGGA